MRRTFDQVVTLRDVREQLVEVCIAFAAGYSETGNRHEVRCDLVRVVGRVVGPFATGGVVAGLNERRSSGTFAGSISGKFERGHWVVWSKWGCDRTGPAMPLFDNGLLELFSYFVLRRHGNSKSGDRKG